MARKTNTNWSFVLSGGGARGAYTAGVVTAFQKLFTARQVSSIYGVSTGALVAALAASGKFVELGDLYTSVSTSDILASRDELYYSNEDAARGLVYCIGTRLLSATTVHPSVFSVRPLERLIDRHAGEKNLLFEKLRKNKDILVGFSSVNLDTGDVESVTNRDSNSALDLRQAMLASASFPVFMPAVERGRYEYTDGGLREFLPVKEMLRGVAKHGSPFPDVIVCVSLGDSDSRSDADYADIVNVAMRSINLLSFDVGQEDEDNAHILAGLCNALALLTLEDRERVIGQMPASLQTALRQSKSTQLIFLRPGSMPVRDPLVFRPQEMRIAYDMGLNDGAASLAAWFAAHA